MGVRVRVRICYRDRCIETSALANTGFETTEPEIHIPVGLARRLGFPLERLKSERYLVVGSEVTAYTIGYVDVQVVASDKVSDVVRARAITVSGEYEVILSDMLIEKLGIVVVKPGSGLWRFLDEDGLRESVEPEYWFE